MATITPTPTHPTLLVPIGNLEGSKVNTFRPLVAAQDDKIQANARLVQAHLERLLTSGLGNGWLSGGAVTIGTGLSVNVAAGSAFVGSWVGWDAAVIVGGLAASATNRIWLWQDGSFTATQTATVPVDAARGQAFLWATATTSATAVTAVDEAVRITWPAAARAALALGTMATQAASNVAITGGTIAGITDLAVADGGTGASSAPAARMNLGAAASGANSDITSLTGLTTALSVPQGGTGGTTQATARTGLGLGTVATANSGTAAGEVPLLGPGGRFADGILPVSVPTWIKASRTFANLAVAAAANDIEIYSLPAGGVVHGVKIKHSAAFTGGTLTAYTASVGVPGNLTKYSGAFNVFQPPGNTVFQLSSTVGSENHGAATSLRLAVVATGANLDAATAGAVEVWILVSVAV